MAFLFCERTMAQGDTLELLGSSVFRSFPLDRGVWFVARRGSEAECMCAIKLASPDPS
jgi:hypothetical protein